MVSRLALLVALALVACGASDGEPAPVTSETTPPADAASALDTSFGSSGRTVIDFGGNLDSVNIIKLAPDGKIVVAGRRWKVSAIGTGLGEPDEGAIAIARLDRDGKIDPTFGGSGVVHARGSAASGMVVDADGSVIVASCTKLAEQSQALVLRLLPNGKPDPSFGVEGRVELALGGTTSCGSAIALDASGRILVAGGASHLVPIDSTSGTGTKSAGGIGIASAPPEPATTRSYKVFALARLDRHGALDATFGTGGRAQVDCGDGRFAFAALTLGSDGRAVLTGVAGAHGIPPTACVARIDPAGDLDAGFGVAGFARIEGVLPIRTGLDATGRVLVAGYRDSQGGRPQFNMSATRLLPDGRIDSAYGRDGAALIGFAPVSAQARALAFTGDGKLLLAGETGGVDVKSKLALARRAPDGAADDAFGSEGRMTLTAGVAAGVNDLALDANGSAIVTGSVYIDSRAAIAAGDGYAKQVEISVWKFRP